MSIHALVLIIFATIWFVVEFGLILRDRRNSKGSTKSDQMTRVFNTISLMIVIYSPLLSFLLPMLQFSTLESISIILIGVFIMVLGAFIRYWSIIILGKYFVTTVEIGSGQRIIQKGPYKYIRHPSYTGIIVFCLGYGLVSQNWLSLGLCILSPLPALLYRIKIEENVLSTEFGKGYKEYQSRTKKLIPGIW